MKVIKEARVETVNLDDDISKASWWIIDINDICCAGCSCEIEKPK